jgi:hypothetical protein
MLIVPVTKMLPSNTYVESFTRLRVPPMSFLIITSFDVVVTGGVSLSGVHDVEIVATLISVIIELNKIFFIVDNFVFVFVLKL